MKKKGKQPNHNQKHFRFLLVSFVIFPLLPVSPQPQQKYLFSIQERDGKIDSAASVR
jgi:hypothetical protein